MQGHLNQSHEFKDETTPLLEKQTEESASFEQFSKVPTTKPIPDTLWATLRYVFVFAYLLFNLIGNAGLAIKKDSPVIGYYTLNILVSSIGLVGLVNKSPRAIKFTARILSIAFLFNVYASWRCITFFLGPDLCENIHHIVSGPAMLNFCLRKKPVLQSMAVFFIAFELLIEALGLATLNSLANNYKALALTKKRNKSQILFT